MSTPIRTAERDANYLSLSRDTIVWFAGTPDEHVGSLPSPLDLIPADPKRWDSVLKCSGRRNAHLRSLRVAQGKENTFDANNGTAFCSFHGDWGVAGDEGEQIFTIKGGSHHIDLVGRVYSRGTDCDVEIGAWSDQSFDKTTDIDLRGLERVDGRPLTVVFGRVRQPWKVLFGKAPSDIKLPVNAKVDIWGSVQEMAAWWSKRLYVLARYRR